MRAHIPAAIAAAALLAPSAASAQGATVQAVDATAANPNGNQWAPSEVTVKVGETVTWRFAGTGTPHNVKSTSPNWSLATPFATAGPDAAYTFTAAGTYLFVCELHSQTMNGKVNVLDAAGQPAPPPPPPPLSEQPFANDTPALSVVEVRDTVAPKLDRVKVSQLRRGVRVRFRLSEAGKVTLKLTRGRKVTTRTVEVGKGTRSATVRGLKSGRYRVHVSAKDLAGNAAKASRRARVTVRS